MTKILKKYRNTFYGWPKHAIISVYDANGELANRSCRGNAATAGFYVCDLVDRGIGTAEGRHVVSVRVAGNKALRTFWTDKRVQRAESNIRFDYADNGFEVILQRIRGYGDSSGSFAGECEILR